MLVEPTACDERPETTIAVVLAGGRARRMGGGDKCLRLLAGHPILDHVLERLRPQIRTILLNANGDPARFAAWGIPVAADSIPGYAGPLAGILTALDWARAYRPGVTDVVSVPGDGPFVPSDLVRRLVDGRGRATLAQAASLGRTNPVVGLWPVALAEDLRRTIVTEAVAKVSDWAARHTVATVAFDASPVDPFFNANTPADLAEAERFWALIQDP